MSTNPLFQDPFRAIIPMTLNSPCCDSTDENGAGKSPQGPILALETSGKSASVALAWPDGRIEEATTDPSIGSARTLAPTIHTILQLHSVKATDLAAVAVTVGPGSFTGLRVGVATAKSIAYALHIPTIAIDTLETIAIETSRRLALETPDWKSAPTSIWTVMDAYRGELFAALWRHHPAEVGIDFGKCDEIQPSHLVDSSEWEASMLQGNNEPWIELPLTTPSSKRDPMIVTGPGLVRCPRLLSAPPPNGLRILSGIMPRAAVVAQLARRNLLQLKTTDPFRLMPVYLRGSAAEEKLHS